jgi:hypothetical protein
LHTVTVLRRDRPRLIREDERRSFRRTTALSTLPAARRPTPTAAMIDFLERGREMVEQEPAKLERGET